MAWGVVSSGGAAGRGGLPRCGPGGALAGPPVARLGLAAAGADAAHLLSGLVEQIRDVGHGVSLAPPLIPWWGRTSKEEVPGRRR